MIDPTIHDLDAQATLDSITRGHGPTSCGCNERTGCLITETTEGVAGFSWQGAWSSATTTYVRGQVVTYANQTFIALQAVPTGQPPQSQGDPYWAVCPYDNLSPKLSMNITVDGVSSFKNGIYPNQGKYSAGASYGYTDSVLGSDGNVYTCHVIGPITGTNPVGDGGTHWTLQTTGGLPVSNGLSGIEVDNTTGITFENCDASYNGSVGYGYGFLVGPSVTKAVFKNPVAVANGVINFGSTWPDSGTNGPIKIENPAFDGYNPQTSAYVTSRCVDVFQSTSIKGGWIGQASTKCVSFRADQATTGATYTLDGVTVADAQGGWPGVQTEAPAGGVTVYTTIVRCTFPNSSQMGCAYVEASGSGTTVSYLDENGLGTVTRTNISKDGSSGNPGFSYAGSAVGRNNFTLPGATGVRGAEQPQPETGNYTLLGIDDTVIFTLAGTATATLPSAATCRKGKRYTVVNANASTSSLTLAATAGSVPTSAIAAGSAVTVVADGTNWQRAA